MKNYKFGIIALIFLIALAVAPAMASISDDSYTNKYVPVSAYDTANLMTYAGHVYGNVKSGHVLEGGEIFFIHRDGAPENATMTARFTPDGLWDGYLPAGEYNITLPQGTGSAAGVYTEDAGFVGNLHPETTHISVVAGKETYFTFIGNSVPTPDSACVPKYTIIEASYGIVHCSDVRVLVTPATEHVWSTWSDDKPWNWNSIPSAHKESKVVEESVWHDGYCHHGWFGWHCHDGYWEPTSHTEYRYVTEDAHVAVYKTECQQDGTVIDVTANVQSVVDRGITSFLFDNRPAEGGIFSADGSTLLEEISDPAPGIRKHVSITYNAGCGTSDKTIKAMEYEVINL
jgi:hypothetical protein